MLPEKKQEKKGKEERPQSHVIIFIRRIIILRCVKINEKRREGENDGDEKLEIRLCDLMPPKKEQETKRKLKERRKETVL